MPELPEVETTRRGIAPWVEHKTVAALRVFEPRLRWPVAADLATHVDGRIIERVSRRAKYLLFEFDAGTLLVHLGMSGSLRIAPLEGAREKHDHIELELADHTLLRYRDPRKFGSWHWASADTPHWLLAKLGPEPLGDDFDGDYLYRASRGRRIAVKSFLMDAKVVVGVGNIYANEALWRAGIAPGRAAGRISRRRYEALARGVREVLSAAIAAGGTTLRDFVSERGTPGYFRHSLEVYERVGEPCPRCGELLRRKVIGQRATYWCASCQR